MKPCRRTVPYALLVAVLLSSGCSGIVGSDGAPIRLISTRNEIALGEKVAPEFESMVGAKVPCEHLQSYVQQVGQRIAHVAERRMPYEFSVVASGVPNSFALPGGRIYVTSGLLALLRSERELAAVLANEVAHVCHRHPIKHLYRQMGGMLLVRMVRLAVEDTDEIGWQSACRIARAVLRAAHTRRDEMVADRDALGYMARAGYSPWGMTEMLARLYVSARSDPKRLAVMLATHPITLKRVKLAKIATELDYYYFAKGSADPQVERFAAAREAGLQVLKKPAKPADQMARLLQ
jgi:predicted Zn-dependent protease